MSGANDLIRPMVDEVKTAARGAVDEMRGMLGQPKDPNLRIYQRLQPADFNNILAEHGQDGLMAYIKAMETLRMQGG